MKIPKATTPFVTGIIAGAIVVTVLGFANGWVVTAESKNVQVKDAWIRAQAAVCASRAEAHLKATENTVSLGGYKAAARKVRDDLARSFAVALPGENAADSIVINACAHMLNRPGA